MYALLVIYSWSSTKMKVPVAAMVNVLGSETMLTTMENSNAAWEMDNAAYGK
jgi:hypothetical protein